MAKFKKLKFNGGQYPYVVVSIYDYDTNRDKEITVSTDNLKKDIEEAVKSNKPEFMQSINNINSKVKHFAPHSMILNDSLETIQQYIQSNNG